MRGKKLFLKPQERKIDKLLLFVVLVVVIFGLVMVFNASVVEAERYFSDKYFYIKKQAVWAGVGILVLLLFSKINFKLWQKLSLPLLILTFAFLVLVLIPRFSIQALGASRWVSLGPIFFQPSELAKLSLVIYLATVLANKTNKKNFLTFFIPVVLVAGLIMLQPDLGTTVVILTMALSVYLVSGAHFLKFFLTIATSIAGGVALIFTSPYRKERLLSFLNVEADPLGVSYHIRQALISIGSGGILGLGLGQGRQKYLFLPKASTDSIFAVIGEELGFWGTLATVAFFLFLVLRGLSIALRLEDNFGKLLAVGISVWLGVQAFINLAAMVSLLPITGIPLPFFSYGGSSLVISLAGVGILLNISRFAPKTT